MLSPRENLLMLVLLVFSTRFGGAEQTDTKNPNVTTVANTKGATRPREDRCVMHLGRVIIGCGSICRDGFHVSGTNGPRVVPPRRSVRVPTSEPRVQGTPPAASGSGSGQSHLGSAGERPHIERIAA